MRLTLDKNEIKEMDRVIDRLSQPLTDDQIIERERANGVEWGPYRRQKILETAPRHVRQELEFARVFPTVTNSRATFSGGADYNDFPPASFTAVSTTTTETNLWNPIIWTPIPANDPRAGKVYCLEAGGIISNTVTPTIIFNPRWGQNNATPPVDVSVGISPTVTTVTGLANHGWFARFVLGFRSLGVAASGATGTGNGLVTLGNASAGATAISLGGTVVTTLDTTTAQGLHLSMTWGTNSASNTITAQWCFLRSLS